jgi:hypothetical protein
MTIDFIADWDDCTGVREAIGLGARRSNFPRIPANPDPKLVSYVRMVGSKIELLHGMTA